MRIVGLIGGDNADRKAEATTIYIEKPQDELEVETVKHIALRLENRQQGPTALNTLCKTRGTHPTLLKLRTANCASRKNYWERYGKETTVNSLVCLLYTSPSPRDVEESRMPSSA